MSKKDFLPGSDEHAVLKVLTSKGYAMSLPELRAELAVSFRRRGRGRWPRGVLGRMERKGVLQVTQDGGVTMYGLKDGVK